MKQRLARLVSNILNPFLVSFAIILLLSFESTSGTAEALKWAGIALAISVLPVWLTVLYLVRRRKIDSIFSNTRRQRTLVYLISIIYAVVSCAALYFLKAPDALMAIFSTGLAAVIIFTGINALWKISLHTAFIAGAVTVMIIIYKAPAALTLILLPPVGWSRLVLKQHTPTQVVTGALLAAAIVFVVFYLFHIFEIAGLPA